MKQCDKKFPTARHEEIASTQNGIHVAEAERKRVDCVKRTLRGLIARNTLNSDTACTNLRPVVFLVRTSAFTLYVEV